MSRDDINNDTNDLYKEFDYDEDKMEFDDTQEEDGDEIEEYATEAEEDLVEQDDISDDEPLLDTDNLEVQIRCEIGKVSLSLAELSKIKIGDTIEFMRWPTQLVKLSVNNNYFAQGLLVEINGMLGVKIIKK
ncbi:MAG: FliM/FliN family flagellar motor switch protein [Proteobacteria bacterium]|jgi:flagellar motor switch/type III secretory pathway protein FliN|nr:FliM/FliN family flagellar motor switch protein [Pseudomonadota bacterium]